MGGMRGMERTIVAWVGDYVDYIDWSRPLQHCSV